MKNKLILIKISLAICTTGLLLGLIFSMMARDLAFPNHVYMILLLITVISGLGAFLLTIALAIINQQTPTKNQDF